MIDDGLTEEEAVSRVWMNDADGLVVTVRFPGSWSLSNRANQYLRTSGSAGRDVGNQGEIC